MVVVFRGQAAVVHFQELVQQTLVDPFPVLRVGDVEKDLQDLSGR